MVDGFRTDIGSIRTYDAIAVTGASGFLGKRALHSLADRDVEIHALSTRDRPAGLPKVNWHRANPLRQRRNGRRRLGDQADALHSPRVVCGTWGLLAFRGNLCWVSASLELAQAFQKNGGQRFVGIGSCAEYSLSNVPITEESPASPATLYDTCKIATYRVLERFFEARSISFAWARIFLYGLEEPREKLLRSTYGSLRRGSPVHIANGNRLLDFIHVGDAAAAITSMLTTPVRGAINIGSGEATSVRAAVTGLAKMLGKEDQLTFGTAGERDEIVADITRMRDELGFRAMVSLEAGLQEFASRS